MKKVDLNCDLGEWRSDNGPALDEAIMPFISSCNIACGGHAGDIYSMKKTIELALRHNVAIGAHPSYPDREGFGRRRMEIEDKELENSIRTQILDLKSLVENAGSKLHHVKPHGALYNTAAVDEQTTSVIVAAVTSIDGAPKIYGKSDSVFEKAILDEGLRFISEVFADRVYEDDLSLRSRSKVGAILFETSEVIDQIRSMVLEGTVTSFSGNTLTVKAETICLHSDTEGAAELAREIHYFLKKNDVRITAA